MGVDVDAAPRDTPPVNAAAERFPDVHLTLCLTHDCNLRCRYCYGGSKSKRHMTQATGSTAIERAIDRTSARLHLVFFGGEPLLRWRTLATLTDHARKCAAAAGLELRPTVTTNGTLLTGARVAWLRKNGFVLAISCDGDRLAHDANRRDARGRSSHARTTAGLRRALVAGLGVRTHFTRGGPPGRTPGRETRVAAGAAAASPPDPPRIVSGRALDDAPRAPRRCGEEVSGYAVRTILVLDPANLDRLPASLAFLHSLGASDFVVNPNWAADWTGREVQERWARAYGGAARLWVAAHRERKPFWLSFLDDKIAAHLKGGYTAAERCDLGRRNLVVAPSGRLYPCDRLVGEDRDERFMIGDVASGPVAERIAALVSRTCRLPEDCLACAIAPRCRNRCACANLALTGAIDTPSETLCFHEQLAVRTADEAAALLFAERNESFLRRHYGEDTRRGDTTRG